MSVAVLVAGAVVVASDHDDGNDAGYGYVSDNARERVYDHEVVYDRTGALPWASGPSEAVILVSMLTMRTRSVLPASTWPSLASARTPPWRPGASSWSSRRGDASLLPPLRGTADAAASRDVAVGP